MPPRSPPTYGSTISAGPDREVGSRVIARRAALSDLHARDRARDHEPLDLRGALEDRVDLRVAVHPLHRELPRVAVAAQDLYGPLGHQDRDLARLELRHRDLG